MSRKTFIIVFVIILFVALNAIGYVFLYQNHLPQKWTQTPAKIVNSIFPVSDPKTGEDVIPPGDIEPLFADGPESASSTITQNAATTINFADFAVSGTTNLTRKGASSWFYSGRENGNIFLFDPKGTGTPVRLSNTTIDSGRETLWGLDKTGLRAIFRRINGNSSEFVIITLAEKNIIPNLGEPVEASKRVLPSNIIELVVSPTKDKIFTIEARTGGVDGFASDFDFKTKNKIFSSPFSEWIASWPNETTVALATKPTADFPGDLFFLNTKTKEFKPVVENVSGLVVSVSPDAKKVIYSKSENLSVSLYLKDIATGKTLRVGLNTLAEKCAWNGAGEFFCAVPKKIRPAKYPDYWYQGRVTFDDDLWRIDAATGNSFVVASGEESGGDLTNLKYEPKSGILIATEKGTGKMKKWEVK